MKKNIAAFFSGIGTAALIGLGLTAYRHRGQIAQRGRELADRGRQVAERGRVRGRRIAEHGRRIAQRGQQLAEMFRPKPDLDLNGCSTDQLVAAGVQQEIAERIIESRPYRSKLELIERVMLPSDVYALLKNRVWVSGANEPVKVAV